MPEPHAERAVSLFDSLPKFPPALPDDDLRLLAKLPDWPTQMELRQEEESVAKRLQKRGLVQIEWARSDPINIWRTGYAGRLSAAGLNLCSPAPPIEGEGDGR